MDSHALQNNLDPEGHIVHVFSYMQNSCFQNISHKSRRGPLWSVGVGEQERVKMGEIYNSLLYTTYMP